MASNVDVLFINPGDRKQIYQNLADEFSAVEPPVFAGLFATYARRHGYEAAIYDVPALMVSAEEAAKAAIEHKPRLVVLVVYGFQPSASTQNMGSAGKIARLIREAAPDLPIMMTGTHPAALPEQTMREEAVDFVCDLEGPVTIVKTLEAMAAGGGEAFAAIPSLWWRRGGEIVRPATGEQLIKDLDEAMPGIAWDLLPMEKYRAHNWHCFDHIEHRQPYAAIHTSLGCPYKCSFCCINAPFGKNAYRMWSPRTIVEEIDFLVEKHGVKNIKFVDEMFVLNRSHVLEICDLLIERGHDLNIWAYARVDTVQDDMLDKLRAAGFNWLCLGIESASAYVRDGARKAFKGDDIKSVVRRIQGAGIRVLGNYIFGLPDDTWESMRETLELALDINTEFANFYSAMAYPGSDLYRYAVTNNIQLPAEWKDYSQHGFQCTPLANPKLTAAEILTYRDYAWQTYFSAPGYLALAEKTFGPAVVDHIARMRSVPLARAQTAAIPAHAKISTFPISSVA